ncbi:MAG: isopentenyl-diphosphate Delta-isomerase [Nocardioidaceae bacterium]|nr:isopentenyl-diphosphate Delta-isomerase [Nocardioidaceae bacterium]
MADADLVVLLDDDGSPVGTAPRAEVHTDRTPLHLAFSCYVLDADRRILLTRRALSKRTWPGVWTNSFCGHPRPGEDPVAAVHRYAAHELGTVVTDLRCVLPAFRYRAVDASGVVENELCPVHVGTSTGTLDPCPDEVAEHRWVTAAELRAAVASAPWALSPWLVEQLAELDRTGAWTR